MRSKLLVPAVLVPALLLALAAPPPANAQSLKGKPITAPIARLIGFEGTIEIVRQGLPIALYPDLPLFTSDVILQRAGRSAVRFTDQTTLDLRAETRVVLTETEALRAIEVTAGRVVLVTSAPKVKPTTLRTGGVSATITGTAIEYAVDATGVAIGMREGTAEISALLSDGSIAKLTLAAGEQTAIGRSGWPKIPVPFRPGQIADATGPLVEVQAPVPPPAAPVVTEAPLAPAPAPEPEPAPAVPPPVPDIPPMVPPSIPPTVASGQPTGDAPTQGEYAIRLINALGIASALPANATVQDAMDFLARLGIAPAQGPCDCFNGPRCQCGGLWVLEEIIRLEDLLCIAGVDPCDPNAPVAISLDELIEQILAKYSELFWIQTRKKLTVSPFAP